MGPHSVVVVYVNRAIAALALPAIGTIIGALTRSLTGTLALAFALSLTFTHGRLSSTGEPESLDGGGSRPPEVLLPESAGVSRSFNVNKISKMNEKNAFQFVRHHPLTDHPLNCPTLVGRYPSIFL